MSAGAAGSRGGCPRELRCGHWFSANVWSRSPTPKNVFRSGSRGAGLPFPGGLGWGISELASVRCCLSGLGALFPAHLWFSRTAYLRFLGIRWQPVSCSFGPVGGLSGWVGLLVVVNRVGGRPSAGVAPWDVGAAEVLGWCCRGRQRGGVAGCRLPRVGTAGLWWLSAWRSVSFRILPRLGQGGAGRLWRQARFTLDCPGREVGSTFSTLRFSFRTVSGCSLCMVLCRIGLATVLLWRWHRLLSTWGVG